MDGEELSGSSSIMPYVTISQTDIPLYFGGEAGIHFGKNGLFLIGHYNYGFRDIGHGITGRLLTRSYGVTLQYRREIF